MSGLHPVRELGLGAPVAFVIFVSAQEVEAAKLELDRVFHHRKDEVSTGTEMSKVWIESLQITEQGVAESQGVQSGGRQLLDTHAINAQNAAGEQSWSSALMKFPYVVVGKNSRLA
jgi:hypothetical protein